MPAAHRARGCAMSRAHCTNKGCKPKEVCQLGEQVYRGWTGGGHHHHDIYSQTFDTLCGYIDEHGYSPSIRELGAILGLTSPDSVKSRLDVLEERGWISRIGPRAIRLETA